jgi:hypothetical protein
MNKVSMCVRTILCDGRKGRELDHGVLKVEAQAVND